MFGGKYIFNYFEKTTCRLLYSGDSAYLLILFYRLCIDSFVLNLFCLLVFRLFWTDVYSTSDLNFRCTESDWQGRVMGVVAALSSVTWGVGPLLTGALNQYGSSIAFITVLY